MSAKYFWTIAFLAFTFTSLKSVQGMAIAECKGINMTETEEHIMHMNDCLKAAGAKDVMDIEMSKAGCFSKCVFMKKGLIDDKGQPHKEKLLNMVDGALPADIKAKIKKGMEDCLDNEDNKVDVNEEGCGSFLTLGMCMHSVFMEVCL